jgi:hypothetical protein
MNDGWLIRKSEDLKHGCAQVSRMPALEPDDLRQLLSPPLVKANASGGLGIKL